MLDDGGWVVTAHIANQHSLTFQPLNWRDGGKCRVSKKSKGIALVTFEEAQPAEAARAALDGSFFQGRLLHVLPARPPPAVVAPAPQV